ncbi:MULTISPECIES: ABC transporter permease [unclassified Thermosipho (in: thermotogales)]|uniref:ABC transporter permease n=1 Tax=unclassified Thermosipho (in: thermotogales) TaxID=2676525 RepID=UPI000A59471D|nr:MULTISPECIES: ABC transporter permease [unclassified Thermosipho (in: thermotogales)]
MENFIKFAVKLFGFIKRDVIIWFSYRTQFILGFLSGFVGIIQFGLIGKFIAGGNYFPLIEKYGGDILAYFITGSVFMSYTNLALSTFKASIQREQRMGTLEYFLLSDTPFWQLFAFNFLSGFLFTTFNILFIFFALVWLFSVKINPNIFASFLVLLVVMLPLIGIGLISAAIILITKRGDPVGWIYFTLTGLFSGIYYPVEIMPKFIRGISYLLPSTYGMDLLRKTLLKGYNVVQIRTGFLVMVIMGLVLIPFGVWLFKLSFNKARKEGTLAWY